ncbi:MAG: hypothetical protein EHM61_06740 [Acidobacteria bacterium]|nr:MAG: hypothetical protein EHM61_06740 [Acidobacteriota bacterium]
MKRALTAGHTTLIFLGFIFSNVLFLPAETPAQKALPLIFPIPQETERRSTRLEINTNVEILVPEAAKEHDLFLARILAADLTDRFHAPIKVRAVSQLPDKGSFILLGSIANPLVQRMLDRRHSPLTADATAPEGYLLEVDEQVALVAGRDDPGAFYGLQSLRQLIRRDSKGTYISGVRIRDFPYKPFRGVKLFLPGRDHIPFFKRFVSDFMALYKYNKLILEMNAGMRLERHPELNEGWIELARNLNYTRRDRPLGPGAQYQNSVHHDTADGGVLEQEEVADLVKYAQQYHIEVIPELPSLTHSYYLLSRHRELAEVQTAEWPDTYCPLNPGSYELLFDVMDEYIKVMAPRMVHIGHDEWRMPVDACPRCKDKDKGELFLQDVVKIHNYLKGKGVKTALWGDHLVEAVRGSSPVPKTSPTGYKYQIPEAVSPEQIEKGFPKDILVINWFWDDRSGPGTEGWGKRNDLELQRLGFQQVYGNFRPQFPDWAGRSSQTGVLGGAPSCWAVTSEFSLGKDRLSEFLGCANVLWSTHELSPVELSRTVSARTSEVRRNLSGRTLPSEEDNDIAPLSIAKQFDLASKDPTFGIDLKGITTGVVVSGKKTFNVEAPPSSRLQPALLARGLSDKTAGIEVSQDASSVLFLQACAKPASNDWVDRYVYNPDDTADLVGWYEVLYEDALVLTVPLRYRVNILEWNWDQAKSPSNYCYEADLVCFSEEEGNPITFFAFEWPNPRPGKVIKEIRLKAARQFRNTRDEVIPENGVLLAAISIVKRRPTPSLIPPASSLRGQDDLPPNK